MLRRGWPWERKRAIDTSKGLVANAKSQRKYQNIRSWSILVSQLAGVASWYHIFKMHMRRCSMSVLKTSTENADFSLRHQRRSRLRSRRVIPVYHRSPSAVDQEAGPCWTRTEVCHIRGYTALQQIWSIDGIKTGRWKRNMMKEIVDQKTTERKRKKGGNSEG